MSGNRVKGAGGSSLGFEKSKKTVNDICDAFLAKINERFNSVAAAFRYFDVDGDSKVSYNELLSGCEKISVALDSSQLFEVFKLLDFDGDGTISYNEFCLILEDKRKGMDPI